MKTRDIKTSQDAVDALKRLIAANPEHERILEKAWALGGLFLARLQQENTEAQLEQGIHHRRETAKKE